MNALSLPHHFDERPRQIAPRKKLLRGSDVVVRAAVCELLRPISWGARGAQIEESAAEVAARVYRNCEATLGYLARTAVNPAMTSVAGWAAELIETGTVDFLTGGGQLSGLMQLSQKVLTVPPSGAVRVPSRAHPFSVAAAWVAEGGPKPVYQITLGSVSLAAKKVEALSTFSQELARASVPSIELVLTEALRHDIGARADMTLFGTAAATSLEPAGLFYNATAVTASTATTSTDRMLEDVAALVGAVAVNAPDAVPIIIAHGKQGVRLRAQNIADVIVSNFMPVNSVGAIDANGVVLMLGDLKFRVSTDGTVHADTAPAAAASPGTPNSVSAPLLSLWQADLIGVKAQLYADWSLRRSGASALASSVTW